MATRKPIYLDSEGFPTEFSPLSDGLELETLTVAGEGGITLISGSVYGVPTPVAGTDAVNKDYVDNFVQGLDVHASVLVTTSGVDLVDHVGGGGFSYNPTGGIGGTGEITGAPTELDGVTPLVSGTRILVKDQADPQQNGIYVVTVAGTWERATDMDEDDEITAGAFVFVEEGDINGDNGFVVTSDDPHVLNTDDIVWSQFSGAGQIVARAGLIKDGNSLDVELDTAADAQGAGVDGGSSGLEFDVTGAGGKLRAAVSADKAINRYADGLGIEIYDTTLVLTTSGIGVLGVPANFEINGVAVSNNVTGANIDELTGGGPTLLHTHAGAGEAASVQNTYTTDGVGVSIGDPLYFSADGIVSSADSADASANQVVGLAVTTVGASAPVELISDGRLDGVLSGATAGDQVYLAVGGGLTTTKPAGGGNRITLAGFAINATDMQVEINFLGRLN